MLFRSSNLSGELGNGTGISPTTPVSPTALGAVMFLAAGSKSSLAIRPDGNLFAWGSNSTGALGLGVSSQKNVPIELLSDNLTEVNTFAAGGNHNLITQLSDSIHPSGSMWAWGSNTSGQLGAGNTLPYAEPHEVLSVPPFPPMLSSASSAAAGLDFSLVLKSDGTVLAAGQNTYGQLGRSLSVARSTTFYPIGSSVPASPVPIFGSVSAGRWHGLALTNDRAKVFAWGYGSFGQLGNGTTPIQQMAPTEITALSGAGLMTTIAAGQYHSMVRKDDGTVWAWGQNSYGQVGNTTSTDKKVPNQVGLPGAALNANYSIAAGLNHNLAVRFDATSTVASWG